MIAALAAVELVNNALKKTVEGLEKFVEALAPGVMDQFNRAIRDLQATIGVALVGAFTILTGLVREISGALLPAAQALAPVFDQLAEVVGDLLITAAQQVASVLKLLAPALEFVAFLLNQLSEIMRVWNVVVMALWETFVELLESLFPGFNLKNVMNSLADAVHQAIKALLVFVATMARLFGFPELIDKIISGLKESQGAVAAGTFSFKDFLQTNKDIALAALQAVPGGDKKKKDMEDFIKTLEDMKTADLGLLGQIKDKVIEILWAIQHPGQAALNYAASVVPDPFKRPLIPGLLTAAGAGWKMLTG